MITPKFALAIVLPGAGAADIVHAAIKNEVHIIDKEEYLHGKDYLSMGDEYREVLDGDAISLLFVLPGNNSLLGHSVESLESALKQINVVD